MSIESLERDEAREHLSCADVVIKRQQDAIAARNKTIADLQTELAAERHQAQNSGEQMTREQVLESLYVAYQCRENSLVANRVKEVIDKLIVEKILHVEPDPPVKSPMELLAEKIITVDHDGLNGIYYLQITKRDVDWHHNNIRQYVEGQEPAAKNTCDQKAKHIREFLVPWFERIASDARAEGMTEGIKNERERITRHILSLAGDNSSAAASAILGLLSRRIEEGK